MSLAASHSAVGNRRPNRRIKLLLDSSASFCVAGRSWTYLQRAPFFKKKLFILRAHNEVGMAKRPGTDDGMLNSPPILRDFAPESDTGDVNMDSEDGTSAVSLQDILRLYNQPINEEQAWAVCYQCCRTLAQKKRRKSLKSVGASAVEYPRRIEGPGDVMIWRDGTVKLHFEGSAGKPTDTN